MDQEVRTLTDDLDPATRLRGLEIRHQALEERVGGLCTLLEQNNQLLSKNNTMTEAVLIDLGVVKDWVETWKAGIKVADLFSRMAKPVGKITGWASAIAAAYYAWKQTSGR